MHVIITVLIIIKVGDTSQFFMKKADVFNGIGSGVLIFICAWMIIYNVVYTLWMNIVRLFLKEESFLKIRQQKKENIVCFKV